MIDLSKVRVVDLTDPLRTGMPVYPGDPEVEINQVLSIEHDEESVFEFQMSSQSGTHLQSGFYFLEEGLTLDKVNPTSFFGWTKIIDVPSSTFSLQDVGKELIELSNIDFIIFRSGYGEKLTEIKEEDLNSSHRPRMGLDVAEHLVQSRISLVGIDSFGLDPYNDFRVNKLLCKAEILILEGLINLFSLRKTEIFLICLPLLVTGTEGAPTRVLALEPK